VRTGKPIVYTSGDSVFQIAAHEEVIPIAELYRMCEIARKLLDGPHRVGRVIARPFAGTAGNFVRTTRRHDYAVDPPKPMLMDVLAERKVRVFGVGKIHDIYNGAASKNSSRQKATPMAWRRLRRPFANARADSFFVTWWTLTCCTATERCRRFAKSLEEFDHLLAMFLPLLTLSDLLMITADHGCDPIRAGRLRTIRGSTCRFGVFTGRRRGSEPGVRDTLADMGQTIAENFGGTIPKGKSFLNEMRKQRGTEAAGKQGNSDSRVQNSRCGRPATN